MRFWPLMPGGNGHQAEIDAGTAEWDLPDIDNNLVSMMMEGVGFEVVDLDSDAFVKDSADKNADVIALSALLTTTNTARTPPQPGEIFVRGFQRQRSRQGR